MAPPVPRQPTTLSLLSACLRMVDLQDPLLFARDYCTYASQARSVPWKVHSPSRVTAVLVKFYHVVGGLYMCVYPVALQTGSLITCCVYRSTPRPSWEFITTLDYEWSVIQGRRRYRWTIWVCN
jgi:hypothetical protein